MATPPVKGQKQARLDRAVRLYRDFTGMEPEHADTIRIPSHDVLLAVGFCDGIMYTTVREGQQEKYIHRFKQRARPVLASSFDGQQLYLIAGSYTFTDRGIVDD